MKDLKFGDILFHVERNISTNLFQPYGGFSGEIVPNSIYLEPNLKCNRKCRGCYDSRHSEDVIMDSDFAHEAYSVAEELGVHYISWIGGEPFLPKVVDLTLGVSAEHDNISTVICTNGDFVDNKLAERIAIIRSVVPFISIDGFELTNDLRRGKDSYRNVTRAMGILKKRQIMFGYSTVITSQNVEEVSSEAFLDEMIDKGNFVGVYHLFIPNTLPSLQVSPKQFAESTIRLNDFSKKKPLYILSTEFGKLSGRVLQKGKHLLSVAIDPFGNVRTERGGSPIGKITKNRNLKDIIFDENVQSTFRSKLMASEEAPEDCGRKNIGLEAFELLTNN